MFPEGLKTTLHIYGTDPYDHSRFSQEACSYNILEREGEMEQYKRHLDKLKKTGEYGYYYIYVCDLHKRTMDLVMFVEHPQKQRMEINLKAKASNKPKRKNILGSPSYHDTLSISPQLWHTPSDVVISDNMQPVNPAPNQTGVIQAALDAIHQNTQAQLAMQQAELQLQTTTGTLPPHSTEF